MKQVLDTQVAEQRTRDTTTQSDVGENDATVEKLSPARGLPDAAASGNSLMGYAAINGMADQDSIAQLAYDFYQNRERQGLKGAPEDDWFRAELEIRGRTDELKGKR